VLFVFFFFFYFFFFFFFQAEDGIRDLTVTGVQTCALPISKTNNRKTVGSSTNFGCIFASHWCSSTSFMKFLRLEFARNFILYERSEERRVGKECRFRWGTYQ